MVDAAGTTAYTYTGGDQLLTEDGPFASDTVTNTYDRIGQLKIADSSVNTEDRGYTYDTAWNLNYLTNNGVSSTFTADNRNELSKTKQRFQRD